jgi:chorismate dehydratase
MNERTAGSRNCPSQRIDRLRVGAVNYLNSKPLIEGLAELAPEAELVLDYPSRLADRLSARTLDVALVPSIACLLAPHYEVVSDACVASRGPVLSVKLYFRKAPEAVRRLALDAGSRTSAALARILLGERFGIFPELEPLPLDQSTAQTDADAVLLIGDRAINSPAEAFDSTWDLGEEWTRWTGLPFVFAMWGTPRGTALGQVEQLLSAARDKGLHNLRAIARREARLLGLAEHIAIEYLTRNLYYRLGDAERQGLARFHQLAVKHKIAPEGIDLVFRHCACA